MPEYCRVLGIHGCVVFIELSEALYVNTVALYLDKLSQPMEKMIIDMCPPDITLRFLSPTVGEKGDFADADCIFVTTFNTPKEIIEKCPKLKLIQRTGVGVDHVDVAYAKEKGIHVSICKGFNATSVAELAVLDMLALYRRLVILDNLGKKGEWHTWTYRHDSYELLGKTVGVIGAGAIGRELIKRVKPFETRVIYSDVNRMSEEDEKALGCEHVPFDKLIESSDIISIHAPLTAGTRGMIGKAEFERMKSSVILINTARTQIVDHVALVDALRNKRIWGAAVDVFEKDDPLFGLDDGLNVIITPHIGAATYDNYERVYKFCLENVQRIGRGETPLFLI